MNRIALLAAVLTLASACSLYSEDEDVAVDSGVAAPTVTLARAESCRTACSATTDRAYLGQACPSGAYADCEAECISGVAAIHWCPLPVR